MVAARPSEKLPKVGSQPSSSRSLEAVDGVAQVVAHPVGHVVEVVGGAAHEPQDLRHDRAVVLLAVRADQVGLPDRPALDDRHHRVGVVVDVDPVAHVEPGAVELGPAPVEQVGDLARDELLHVLVGPVVVGAVADRGPHAEGAHPGPHQQVRARLGRRVRARGPVRRRLGEPHRVVDLEVAVHLVGADVVVAHVVPPDRLQQGEGADDVGVQERAGVAQRVVVVGLGGEVDHDVGLGHQRVDGRRVGDVTDDQAAAVRRQVGQGALVAGVGEQVEHGHPVVGLVDDVADEVRPDEAGAPGHQKVSHVRQVRRTRARGEALPLA